MKPEDQRIAIAEWCGWRLIGVADGAKFSNSEQPLIVQRWVNETANRVSRTVPDYLNDLNAMHEAELHSFKTAFERVEYRRHLENVASRTREPDEENVIDSMETWAMFATAAQRAEALLRTIGKWTNPALHTKG